MDKIQLTILVTAAVLVLTVSTVSSQGNRVPRPAFSAGLTHSLNMTNAPDNITYDRVFLDTSKSYNPNTGVYTVPVSGDYVIFIHGLAELDGQLYLELYQNDKYILSAYDHTLANYGSASNTAVLPLKAGDHLYVQGVGDTILYGYPEEVYATFSLYLLYAHRGTQP